MNDREPEVKRISGYILARTEKAIQFECWELAGISLCDETGDPRKEWFPLSQCPKMMKVREQSEMDWIDVPTWLLRKKEFV